MSSLTLVPRNVHLIRDVFTDFLLSREAMLCSPATLEFYQYTTGVFVKWLIKNSISEPSEIESSHVRSYLKSLKDRNLADNTLHSHARAIKTFLRFCYSERYISQHVNFEMPRVAKKAQPILNPEELSRILSHCNILKHRTLIVLMLDTGLRRAEVSSLQWQDIDISSGLVRVRRGKGGKARSTVIGVKSKRILLRYRRTVANEPNDSVFKLTGHGIRMALRRIGERAGLRLTAHMLRRTFATYSLRSGMNVFHLQGLLGHSTLEMVRQYAQIIEDDLVDAHRQHGPVDRFLK